MTHRPSMAPFVRAAVLTMVVLVGLPAAAAQATTATTKTVSIVPPSSTCTALFACFKPSSFTIAPGTMVTWKNTTTISHTVTRCTIAACGKSGGTGKDAAPNSPILAAGKTYAFTFHSAGTYLYYCKIHGYSNMHASFTVS